MHLYNPHKGNDKISQKSYIINYSSLQGKTREDSLINRIQSANKQMEILLENKSKTKKTEKISPPPPKPKQTTTNQMTTEDNIKSTQVATTENNLVNENNNNNEIQETVEGQKIKINKNNVINEEKIEMPFIKKTKNLLNELKKLKEKGEIKEEEINKEIEELPSRALIEMSLSDFRTKKKYEAVKKELSEKNEYIKKLENEIVNQRLITNKLKKKEGENLLKISALEDELRVMKLKLLGYNTSEQYNYHAHEKLHTDANNCGHMYGEKLIQSLWVGDNNNIRRNNMYNFDYYNGRPMINKGEKWQAPWVSQSQGNMGPMLRNFHKNYNNEMGRIRTAENRNGYDFMERNDYNGYGGAGERYDSYNNGYNGYNGYDYNRGNNDFKTVSGMILETPHRIKLTRNFNGFQRYGNPNEVINNNN